MSTSFSSREPSFMAQTSTLAMILAGVIADESLTKRQRQDLASALRTVAKALGRPLDDLSAHPGQLRDRLKDFVPAMAGISPGRWANTMSLTRQALKRAGLVHVPARSRVPFAPRWTALFRLLQEKQARLGLTRFARYCTVRGIDPGEVGDATFAAYLEDLTTASLSELPRKLQRRAVVIWSRMAEATSDWPQQAVTIPDYRRTYALPWKSFPPTLKRDVDAYLDHQAGTDILDDAGFKPLRPASIRTLAHELSIYLSALVHSGHDPQGLRLLSDAVAVPVVKDGLRFFLERAKRRSTEPSNAQAHRIAFRVRCLAQHWVKVDAAHLLALRRLCKNLDPGHAGMTEKNRSRLRQFDDPDNVQKLVRLPEKLVQAVVHSKAPSRAEALLLQSALAVEVLLMLPIRRANLAGLNLERHFARSRRGVVHLVIPGHEVKNGTGIEAILPPQTVQLLDLYIARYRPLLLTEASPWLFPGVGNRPKSRERLGLQIGACVKRHCGLLVNPHLFRHIAAKLYLDAYPGAYGVVRLLHGHKSVDTTTRFYCGEETAAAIQHYDAHILDVRRRATAGASASTRSRR